MKEERRKARLYDHSYLQVKNYVRICVVCYGILLEQLAIYILCNFLPRSRVYSECCNIFSVGVV